MQLEGPTQAMQLSCSPRRKALIPSKAVMWAGTSGGTPGAWDKARAFSSHDPASSWAPSNMATKAS